MEAERYDPSVRTLWDRFVAASRNGTFLFCRSYMDYHADRFDDFSVVIRDAKGRVRALLPANRDGDTVISHGGLTYGGFVVDASMHASAMLDVFEACRGLLIVNGVTQWIYKPIPHIYHLEPAEEDLYALFRCGAVLLRRDVGACACPAEIAQPSERLRWWVRKAKGAGVVVEASERLEEYWPVLEENLASRHGESPVHTLAEITLLKSRFPDCIHLFVARLNGTVVAGSIVYETTTVARNQYAATTDEGRKAGAAALLVTDLLQSHFRGKRWFDYGISTEQGGRVLNGGLQRFKEGFGLRAVVADCYSVPLS